MRKIIDVLGGAMVDNMDADQQSNKERALLPCKGTSQ